MRRRAAVARRAQRRDLGEARPILVLEHDATGQRLDDAEDHFRRDLHAGGERIILQHERRRAQRLGDAVEIAEDLVVGAQMAGRRDHDARGAGVHRDGRKRLYRRQSRRRDADNHLRAARAGDRAADESARFLLGQFRRFAHDAENGEAVRAALEVEIDHPVDAAEVERARVREGRGGDDEDALRAFVE